MTTDTVTITTQRGTFTGPNHRAARASAKRADRAWAERCARMNAIDTQASNRARDRALTLYDVIARWQADQRARVPRGWYLVETSAGAFSSHVHARIYPDPWNARDRLSIDGVDRVLWEDDVVAFLSDASAVPFAAIVRSRCDQRERVIAIGVACGFVTDEDEREQHGSIEWRDVHIAPDVLREALSVCV